MVEGCEGRARALHGALQARVQWEVVRFGQGKLAGGAVHQLCSHHNLGAFVVLLCMHVRVGAGVVCVQLAAP